MVIDYLVTRYHFDLERLRATGNGPNKPSFDNLTREAMKGTTAPTSSLPRMFLARSAYPTSSSN